MRARQNAGYVKGAEGTVQKDQKNEHSIVSVKWKGGSLISEVPGNSLVSGHYGSFGNAQKANKAKVQKRNAEAKKAAKAAATGPR
jgi:hypothetical protein